MDLRQRRKDIENQLTALLRQVEGMDNKIRAYLADRQKNPHPRHAELVEKIQRFRIDPAVTSKYLETLLDNLQWKAYYYSHAWKQMWQNAEAKRKAERKKAFASEDGENKNEKADQAKDDQTDNRSIYSVDRLWEVQKEKLGTLGENTEPELKEQFVSRIKQRYGQLASGKADNEEIFMKFDTAEKRCTLAKRKREDDES